MKAGDYVISKLSKSYGHQKGEVCRVKSVGGIIISVVNITHDQEFSSEHMNNYRLLTMDMLQIALDRKLVKLKASIEIVEKLIAEVETEINKPNQPIVDKGKIKTISDMLQFEESLTEDDILRVMQNKNTHVDVIEKAAHICNGLFEFEI